MPKYAIRLHYPYDRLTDFFNRFDVVVVYQHDADEEVSRTHVHALLEATISTDTMKNWVRKLVGHVEKTDWSFKTELQGQPVQDRFITYMSNGILEPKLVKGFTQEVIDNYKSQWIERTEPAPDSKDGSKPGSSTKSTISNWTMAKELAEWITANVEDNKWFFCDGRFICSNPNGREIVVSEVIEQCIKIHRKYEKTYCDFSLARIIQTAYGITDKGSYRLQLVKSVEKKLSYIL